MKRRNSPEEIREAVRLSSSLRGVMRLLGLGGYTMGNSEGGSAETGSRIARFILELGLDTSHFSKPIPETPISPIKEKPRMKNSWSDQQKREFLLKYILVEQSDVNLRSYRTLLVRLGFLTDHCVGCGKKVHVCFGKEWPAPFQIDHVDGNHFNNLPENIRQLCPCCHGVQETSAGKKPKRKALILPPVRLFLEAQVELAKIEEEELLGVWFNEGGK